MRYEEFLASRQLSRRQLVGLAHSTLVSDAPEGFFRLPTPPFMILTRIVDVEHHRRGGRIVGEHEVRFDEWFFQGHFIGDPVQPGCLVLDTVWMVVGLFGALRGGVGQPRALGCSELVFSREVRPDDGIVRYEANIKRCVNMRDRGVHLTIGDARVTVDGEEVCSVKNARFGLFKGIAHDEYPNQKANRGAKARREAAQAV